MNEAQSKSCVQDNLKLYFIFRRVKIYFTPSNPQGTTTHSVRLRILKDYNLNLTKNLTVNRFC